MVESRNILDCIDHIWEIAPDPTPKRVVEIHNNLTGHWVKNGFDAEGIMTGWRDSSGVICRIAKIIRG